MGNVQMLCKLIADALHIGADGGVVERLRSPPSLHHKLFPKRLLLFPAMKVHALLCKQG